MSRTRYLVAYDIADPKRLKAIFKIMRGFGDHLQLSVFLCELNDREKLQMEGKLNGKLNVRQDQVLIVNLGPAIPDRLDNIQSMGLDFVPMARIQIA